MGFLGESDKVYAMLLLAAAQGFNGFNTIGMLLTLLINTISQTDCIIRSESFGPVASVGWRNDGLFKHHRHYPWLCGMPVLMPIIHARLTTTTTRRRRLLLAFLCRVATARVLMNTGRGQNSARRPTRPHHTLDSLSATSREYSLGTILQVIAANISPSPARRSINGRQCSISQPAFSSSALCST